MALLLLNIEWKTEKLAHHVETPKTEIEGEEQILRQFPLLLGFSDGDKQSIGVAQQGVGKGVHGVLVLPGRLVGGNLGGSSSEAATNAVFDNQLTHCLERTQARED